MYSGKHTFVAPGQPVLIPGATLAARIGPLHTPSRKQYLSVGERPLTRPFPVPYGWHPSAQAGHFLFHMKQPHSSLVPGSVSEAKGILKLYKDLLLGWPYWVGKM